MSFASPIQADDSPTNGAKAIPLWLPAAMSIAGVVLVLLGTCRYGVGVSPDSANYLYAARSLPAGKGYWTFSDSPYSAWPPLFPTLLAAIGLAGIDPAIGARQLNAFAMGGIVFASGVFLRRCLRSRLLAAAGTGSVLLSFPLLGICSMAWTEPVFVLLIALFVLQMAAFLRERAGPALLCAGGLAALCCLQRYTGVALIATGAILVLWPGSEVRLQDRLRQLAGFLAISCTPLGLWMVRNYELTGMFTGYVREHSIYSIRENVAAAADAATIWIAPEGIPLAVRVAVVGSLIVLILWALLALYIESDRSSEGRRRYVLAASLVAIVYIPLILYTHQIGILDEAMNDRYLAPLAMILLWLLFIAIDEIVTMLRCRLRHGPAASCVVLAFSVLWIGYPLERTYETIRRQVRHGAGGYSTTQWRESPLVVWLNSHPPEGPVCSNAPDAVYALTGIDSQVSPQRMWDTSTVRQRASSGGDGTLVWFKGLPRSRLYGLEELTAMLPIEEIASFPDGGVYRLAASALDASVDRGVLSEYMVNGARHRRFASDTFGPCGVIRSWVLREDGTTDGVWELHAAEGTVITWSPSGEYSQSGDAFEFRCEGRASRTPDGGSASYRLYVRGTTSGEVATGEYQIEFSGEQWPAGDRGSWRVDVARPVRRWYSPQRGIHAYTMSREQATLLGRQRGVSWVDEGIAFCVYPAESPPPEALPVFRFSSEVSDAGFYTISEAERDLATGYPEVWRYGGIGWYAYSPEHCPLGAMAVHRFWSGVHSAHFYTMDESEKEKLLSSPSQSWTYEGVVWYALPADGR